MGAGDLQIHLSDQTESTHGAAGAVYRPGESIAGSVRLAPAKDYKCNKLTAELKWRTAGLGNVDEQCDDYLVLTRELATRAGEAVSFPFSFTAPAGPVSYDGTVVSVEWLVEVKADVPWALDTTIESPLELLPAPVGTVASDNYRGAPREVALRHRQGETGRADLNAIIAMMPMSSKIGFAIVMFAVCSYVGWTGQWIVLPLAILAAGIGLWWVLHNQAASAKLGKVEARVQPDAALPGSEVNLELLFEGKPKVSWDELTVELVAEERAVRHTGSKSHTHRHEVHREIVCKTGPRDVQDGRFDQRVLIPTDAPPTFGAPSNSLMWMIVVHIDIPKWPDFRDTVEVIVRPRG